MIWAATWKSPSAFSTLSRVSGFIENVSLGQNLLDETIAPLQPTGDEFRRADD
jgi:hypothetical protein